MATSEGQLEKKTADPLSLQTIQNNLLNIAKPLSCHIAVMILALMSIQLIHLALNCTLGNEAKFYDLIPIRYIIDTGDLIVFLKFIWHLIRNFQK
jgi:hypothetical protein